MSNKETGGAAFPVIKNDSYGNPVAQHMGLTVRDYFAAAALTGLCAAMRDDFVREQFVKSAGANDVTAKTQVASAAYDYADKMIAKRAK